MKGIIKFLLKRKYMRNCLFVVFLAGLISAFTSSGKTDNIVVTFDVKNPIER